jgi:hypothetical protein
MKRERDESDRGQDSTSKGYGVWGVGRMGVIHARNLVAQGQRLVALGDQSAQCLEGARRELGLVVETFTDVRESKSTGVVWCGVVCVCVYV